MTEDNAKTVKRVRPYPIDATLKIDNGFKKISVIMVNTLGVIARTPNLMLKVGSEIEIVFELPVLHHDITGVIKVVKTYDRAAQPAGIERMAELHFIRLPNDQLKQIARFMKTIGQAG